MRNPIYLGARVASFGLILENPSVETIFFGGMVFLTTEITSRLEETVQEALHGSDYLDYKAKVPAWIPKDLGFVKFVLKDMVDYFVKK